MSAGEHRTEWTPPPVAEISAFFEGLGIKHHHDIDAAIAALPPAARAYFQKAEASGRSRDDFLERVHKHGDAIGIVLGADFHQIVAVAALLTALPPLPSGAKVLDVGGGPGHLALWMLRCWPATRVTVFDRLAGSVARDWTPALAASDIRFVEGEIPANLTNLAGEHFDRVIVARLLKQASGWAYDVRPFCRKAVTALAPLVVRGGDLIVIDHFHDDDTLIQQSLAGTAKKLGFSHTVKGWRLDPQHPWMLRFVNE